MSFSDGAPDLLSGFVRHQISSGNKEVDDLKAAVAHEQQRLSVLRHLQREYQRKGSAAAYSFSISSNLQIAEDPRGFADALRAVIKELVDQHRYQVTQKLQGGRLNIHVAEAEEPAITWIEQWMGGALSPSQLQKLAPTFDRLRRAAEDRMIVTPDEPIVVDGHVRHGEKHLAARALSTMLQRIDKTDDREQADSLDPTRMAVDRMPLTVGLRLDDAGRSIVPALLPLADFVHASVCGTTGSGKSYFARVLVEEASQYESLNILILDPRRQFSGLLVPEDRPQILQHYDQFGMKPEQARGLPFSYFAPGVQYAPPLPRDLGSLATGRSVVSFKAVDDRERCTLASTILSATFQAASRRESDTPRVLIVVDEAQLLTRKRVDETAKGSAGRAERAMDRIAREGRKYGIVMVLVTQAIKDLGYELASLRQLISTRIFFRNSDNDISAASDIIGDGRLLVQLPTGTALVHNAHWGVHRIRVRPPYSKVYELPERELRHLIGSEFSAGTGISAESRRLLLLIRQYGGPSATPLHMTKLAGLAGITSRRKLHALINDLEHLRMIRTRKLSVRGQPRIVEPEEGAPSQQ